MNPQEHEDLNNNSRMRQYSLFDEEFGKELFCIDVFFKNGPFAYIFLDKFFQVFHVNQRFEYLFKQKESQLKGRNIFELLHGEDALKLQTIFENKDAQHDAVLLHIAYIQGDGSFNCMDTYVKKYTNSFGEAQYCLLMFDDAFKPNEQWAVDKREVFKAIVDTQEQESLRIGRQLHDSVAQLLYAIRLNLQHFVQQQPEHVAFMKPLKQLLNEAIHQIRNISVDLVPSVLHDFGLIAAIRAMVERISTVDFKVDYFVPPETEKLSEDLKLVIYRIIQELLNNTMKHAAATEVSIRVKLSESTILIQVQDNGVGFSASLPSSMKNGSGLRTIKNRTDLYQGELLQENNNPGANVIVKINGC